MTEQYIILHCDGGAPGRHVGTVTPRGEGRQSSRSQHTSSRDPQRDTRDDSLSLSHAHAHASPRMDGRWHGAQVGIHNGERWMSERVKTPAGLQAGRVLFSHAWTAGGIMVSVGSRCKNACNIAAGGRLHPGRDRHDQGGARRAEGASPPRRGALLLPLFASPCRRVVFGSSLRFVASLLRSFFCRRVGALGRSPSRSVALHRSPSRSIALRRSPSLSVASSSRARPAPGRERPRDAARVRTRERRRAGEDARETPRG